MSRAPTFPLPSLLLRTFRRGSVLLAILSFIFGGSAPVVQAQTLPGFTPERAEKQRAVEDRLLELPGSGDVTAGVVYADYGRKEDFQRLRELTRRVRKAERGLRQPVSRLPLLRCVSSSSYCSTRVSIPGEIQSERPSPPEPRTR